MKRSLQRLAALALVCIVLASCNREDPGSLQKDSRSFDVTGFDQVSIGDAMDLTIVQGTDFSVTAQGDTRNLNDLEMNLQGNSLEVRFNKGRSRQYTTYITIVMPAVRKINLSGAAAGRTSGFNASISKFEAVLSGAATADFDVVSDEVVLDISGASTTQLEGAGKKIDAIVSGASTLRAFNYPAEWVKVKAMGASHARVQATQQLIANASGASDVIYRGNPQVSVNASGASTIKQE